MGLGQVAPIAAVICAVAFVQGPANAARVTSLPPDSVGMKLSALDPTIDEPLSLWGRTVWFNPEIVLRNGLRLGTLRLKAREDIDELLLGSPAEPGLTENEQWSKFFPERKTLEFTIDVLQGEDDRLNEQFTPDSAPLWSRKPSAIGGDLFIDALFPTAPEQSTTWRAVALGKPASEAIIPSLAQSSPGWVMSPADGQLARQVHWAQVPLPAATWLYLSALAGLSAFGWYRRRSR